MDNLTGSVCPHGYPQMWIGRLSSWDSLPAKVCRVARVVAQPCCRWSESAPSRWERHCQKLTVLSRSANRSATLMETFLSDRRRGRRCCGRRGSVREGSTQDGLLRGGIRGTPRDRRRAKFAGLTQRIRVSTLEQSPGSRRYGCEPERSPRRSCGARRLRSKTAELTKGCQRCLRADVVAKRNEEIQPWPRASGHSSRTIGVAHGCMDSACGCGRVPGARS